MNRVSVCISVSALFWVSGGALAQGQSTSDPGPQEIEEIVVTGSRIVATDGMGSPTPLTVVSAEDLSMAAPTTLVDGLTRLPTLAASTTARSPASGSHTRNYAIGALDLRGLDPSRTLLLVDGRRIVPADRNGYSDVNLIPDAFISRVEIVTGGASAAYGSDAVAGVVNLVLNTQFEGISGTVQGGVSDYGDGESHKVELNGGTKFADGRGHVMASVSLRHQAEINSEMAARPWARQSRGLVPVPGVPSNRRLSDVGSAATLGGVILTGPLANTQFLSGGMPAAFQPGTVPSATPLAIIGSPDTSRTDGNIISGSETLNAFQRISYEVSDSFQPYLQMIQSKGDVSYKGNMTFHYGPYSYTIFSENPFIPASIQSQMTDLDIPSFTLARQDNDFGVPTGKGDIGLYDVLLGSTGNIGNWTYDAYVESGKHTYKLNHQNNTDQDKLFAAADAVVDPDTGRVVCRVDLTDPGLYPGCVPINLFGNGTPSSEALAYIKGTSPWELEIEQQVASFTLQGDLFEVPAGQVRAAAGVEYRRQELVQTSDAESQAIKNESGAIRGYPEILQGGVGRWTFTNVKPFSGSYNIREGFAELAVPILRDAVAARSLDFSAAVRYADYSTSGGVVTWKLGTVYAPTDEFRLRATVSRDIRAPNLSELFTAGSQSQLNVRDTITDGSTVAYFGTTTGNPELDPEESLTTTFGLVYQPEWSPQTSFSIDYYNIDIDGAIQSLGAQTLVDQCRDGSSLACDNIVRGSNGQIQRILLRPLNFQTMLVRGFDAEANYMTEAWGGDLTFRLLGTHVSDYKVSVPGGTDVQNAGLYTNPRWRVTAQAKFQRGPTTVSFMGRYIPETTYSNSYIEGVTIDDNSVPARFYADLTGKYSFSFQDTDLEAFLTVNNLFDRDPPIIERSTYSYRTQTVPTYYDSMGRYYTAGFRFNF